MSDVFISYARSGEEQAKRVEIALVDSGFAVWRDSKLPAHRAYSEVIEERLRLARAVVVLWSADATRSHWVRAEADAAREAGTLVQATLDGTIAPMPFNQIQCADLRGADDPVNASGWPALLASVQALARPTAPAQPGSTRPRKKQVAVCVLPFANMSGDSEQEYFSDGISEDITTDLSKVSALKVTARNSAFQYKGRAGDVCDIARRLDVSHVLEGSVRKAGNRVRITAQLIDGATGGHVWADRYDRDLTDIFAIQDEISQAIVDALKVKLLPAEGKAIATRGTENVEAYDLYLMARQHWLAGNHGDPRREERFIKLCECAVEIDPNYAQAWALLAIARSILWHGFGKGDDGVEAAHRALAINPEVAEAYCPIVRQLTEQRHYPEAEIKVAQALRLQPDSWEINKEASRVHMRQRHFEQAARHIEKCLSITQADYYSWGLLLTCYRALGDMDGIQRAATMALAHSEDVLAHDPANGAALSIAARALAALGDADRALDLIERALEADAANMSMRYNLASAHASLSDPDSALALLQPVFEKSSRVMIAWATIDPDVDVLRDDPRFHEMLEAAQHRVGIEASSSPAEALSQPRS
jgi:adenylate cyclase